MIEQALDDDMAAFDQADRRTPVVPEDRVADAREPSARGIDDGAGGRDGAAAARIQNESPGLGPFGADAAGAGADDGAAHCRVERVEYDEARIVDPAIGIFEGEGISPPQRRTAHMVGEIDGPGPRQNPAPGHMIVDEQPGALQPGRSLGTLRRQHEPHRLDEMRGDAQQHLALRQRLADRAERMLFQIMQPAMDQLGRGRRASRGKVVLLDQNNFQATAGSIARNARAIDAAADNGEIVVRHAPSAMFSRLTGS